MDDRSLVDLAIFLRTIAESGVDDVRGKWGYWGSNNNVRSLSEYFTDGFSIPGVLEYYAQFEDPLKVFRENQRKLQEQQQESMETMKSKTIPAWSAFKRR